MLYILRHGTTEWNELRKLQGRTDIPLNENGRSMAKAAHDEYRDVHFDLCFSSPLKRALETAQILLQGRDVPIVTDDRLMEMSFGEYEGSVNYFQDPDLPINVFFRDPASYTEAVGGAESMEELFARADSFLSDRALPEVRKGKDVLIAGHGAMNSAIICRLKNLPVSEFWSNGIEQCKLMQLL